MPIRRFDYCVLGAGVAGTTAVETLRAADRVADIALVSDEPHLMYYRPRLPGYVGGHVQLKTSLNATSPGRGHDGSTCFSQRGSLRSIRCVIPFSLPTTGCSPIESS